MANQTVGTLRNQAFTVFNALKANATSSIFALFAKPIEPHYISITPVMAGAATGTITAFLGQLAADGTIVFGPSAGTSAVSGTPIVISGKPAQFLKVTITGFTGTGADSISATAVVN